MTPPVASLPTDRLAEIRLECIRTLYRQIPNSFVAAMGVTLYMVVTTWDKVPQSAIAWWLGLQACAHFHLFFVLMRYRRAERVQAAPPGTPKSGARHYTL